MAKARTLYQSYKRRLLSLYPEEEAGQLVFLLMEHYLGFRRSDILRDREVGILQEEMDRAMQQMELGVPFQYLTGVAHFYGREFHVGPEVLIPRRETEELVYLVLQECKESALKVLDIGTGSGCIPVTLSLEMKEAEVHAVDISPQALERALTNAQKHGAAVDFYQIDILEEQIPISGLDVLVSNPPYVREAESIYMHQNVRDHEPHLALFVADEDPLVFYRVIAEKGLLALKKGGRLYFEINEAFGMEMKRLVKHIGYSQVVVHQDLQGKDRLLAAVR